MKIKLLICGLLLLSGCVPVFIGLGVVAGYTLSNDTAKGKLNASYDELWNASVDVLESETDVITETKESGGVIKGKISDTNTALKIDRITSDFQRLKVSARRYLIPKPDIAQDIFLKIAKKLE